MDISNRIERLMNEIIPPDEYQNRNGFSNSQIIDRLNKDDKAQIEANLIVMLNSKPDMLIVETLGYMRCKKSVPVLYELLEKLDDDIARIITAVSIFEVTTDQKMIEVAMTSFKKIKDKYELIAAFYYLIKFNNPEISNLIQEFTANSDFLISHNAKQVLEVRK